MTDFKFWLDNAKQSEIDRLAQLAETTPAYLRHIAAARREPSAEMAGKLVEAMKKLNREGLEPLSRGDLNKACRECPHFKKCHG